MSKTKTKTKKRKSHDSDLTDRQWAIIAPLIPPAKPGGRPRSVDIRETVNAILYLLKGGCTWRLIPHDFPQWESVYYYFRTWQKDDTWKKIHDTLRGKVRRSYKKKTQLSAGIIDSQSVKTSKKGGFVAMMLVRK